MNGYDTVIQAPFFPAPVLTNAAFSPVLRFGPGSLGPSLFVIGYLGPVYELSPGTLTPTSPQVPLTSTLNTTFTLSNGGSEWLMVCNGSACPPMACPQPGSCDVLNVMNPVTHVITPVGGIPGGLPIVGVLKSASFNKAYVTFELASPFLARVNTDPTVTTIWPPLSLPGFVAFRTKLVVD